MPFYVERNELDSLYKNASINGIYYFYAEKGFKRYCEINKKQSEDLEKLVDSILMQFLQRRKQKRCDAVEKTTKHFKLSQNLNY